MDNDIITYVYIIDAAFLVFPCFLLNFQISGTNPLVETERGGSSKKVASCWASENCREDVSWILLLHLMLCLVVAIEPD